MTSVRPKKRSKKDSQQRLKAIDAKLEEVLNEHEKAQSENACAVRRMTEALKTLATAS